MYAILLPMTNKISHLMQSLILPLPNKKLKVAYLQLTADIDSLIGSLISERFKKKLKCRPGCIECCMNFSVLPMEAAFIAEKIKELSPAQTDDDTNCPFLLENQCSIYNIRPIICRTQGLPIAYINEASSSIEVSACLINFADDYQFSQEDLLFMDRLNHRLAELNLEYCNAAGRDPQKRVLLADLFLC